MNDRQLVAALTRAGFKGPTLKTAYAVAKAESGGRPRAFNPDASTGDRSYGLFQINMLGGLGPARRRQYGLSSNEDLYDPDTNARIAYRMSGGGKDWSPWSAYKSGAYEKYLGNVPAPAPRSATPPSPGGGGPRRSASPAGFRLPKLQVKSGGGLNIGLLTDAILQGRKPSEAIEYAMSQGGEEAQQFVNSIPRLPKFVAENRARQHGGTVQDAGDAGAPNPVMAKVLQIAKNQIGKPYVWAQASPRAGFDCSGLIEYAYEAAGIKTPGRLTTGPMKKMGKNVAWKNIQPGDWIVRHSGGSGHVVMYVGNGQVIASPQTGEVVQFQPLDRFASDTRYSVRRWHGGQ